MCWLNKSLYSLKQTLLAWYRRFASYLVSQGFVEGKADTLLFIYRHGANIVYLLYVDDIILAASRPELLQRTSTALWQEFAMKDVSPLHHFLGVSVDQRPDDLLQQHYYGLDTLDCADMTDSKPCATPMDTQAKVSSDAGTPISDPSIYRSLAEALQYPTFTRTNIYAVY
jgi:hypothetical protein